MGYGVLQNNFAKKSFEFYPKSARGLSSSIQRKLLPLSGFILYACQNEKQKIV